MLHPLGHLPVTNGKCIARVIRKHWPEPHLSTGLQPASAVKLSIWPRCSVGLGSSLSHFLLTPLSCHASYYGSMRCIAIMILVQVIVTEQN